MLWLRVRALCVMKQATVPQCSICCQPYTVTGETHQSVFLVPLLLGSGHLFCSMCVNQLWRVQWGTRVITCPQCAEKTVFLAGEEAAHQLPSNIFGFNPIKLKNFIGLKPQMFSPANLSTFTVFTVQKSVWMVQQFCNSHNVSST